MVGKGQIGNRGDEKGTLSLHQMSMMLNHGGKETEVSNGEERNKDREEDGWIIGRQVKDIRNNQTNALKLSLESAGSLMRSIQPYPLIAQ